MEPLSLDLTQRVMQIINVKAREISILQETDVGRVGEQMSLPW